MRAIDHFAEINLAGFVELTEALGGVPVCLNAPCGTPTRASTCRPASSR